MIIAVYTTNDSQIAPGRRFLAQYEKLKNRLSIHFYGATEAEARAKAQQFWDNEVLPKARVTEGEDEGDDMLGDLL